MAYPEMHEMVWFGGHWWWFPTARTDVRSAVLQWRNNRVYLLEADGTAIEGILFIGEIAPD